MRYGKYPNIQKLGHDIMSTQDLSEKYPVWMFAHHFWYKNIHGKCVVCELAQSKC